MMRNRLHADALVLLLYSALSITPLSVFAAPPPWMMPTAEGIAEARTLVARMKENPRGPYQSIRWFCNDGTILPPTAYACQNHGGGRQHALYSAERERLAELGYSVGTIVAAFTFDELFDRDNRHQRLRELALENYLVEIDDGWVLRRAQYYRGRVQIEGETKAGRGLLRRLLADQGWVAQNFLLAREAVRVIPHGVETTTTQQVRRAIQELAEQHPSVEPIRVEIHSAPNKFTAAKLRRWAADQVADVQEASVSIADQLDGLFKPEYRALRLGQLVELLGRQAQGAAVLQQLDLAATDAIAIGRQMAAIRQLIESPQSPDVRIILFDLLGELETELLTVETRSGSRLATARQALGLIDASFGLGLLTPGERGALLGAFPALRNEVLVGGQTWSYPVYAGFVRTLQRVPQWAVNSVRFHFAEPLARYAALDARANRFADDLLRGSPLAALADVAQRLSTDLRVLAGVGVRIFGQHPGGFAGLNAGHASGTLRIVNDLAALNTITRQDIVVIPETSAELPPVAGILTLGEGNPLSHVQLLARNFSIPNVAVTDTAMRLLEQHDGAQVSLIVGSDMSVVLEPVDVVAQQGGEFIPGNDPLGGALLEVPPVDLDLVRPLPLAELNRGLSGKVVGPKAANLGELNRLFPGRVAPAIAIPFGVFAAHTAQGENSIRDRLEGAYARFRGGDLTEADLNVSLAAIRTAIAGLAYQPRSQLRAVMDEVFGPPGTYGLFVRSDTNVEDLPEFTGAGLSETLANIVGQEAQIDAIARVWSSVLSPRAIAWRSNLLSNPADVYASVLLMRSVPSTKSGVMLTTNIVEPGRSGLTVSTAWGIGGAVSGEVASTIVLLSDGTVQLIGEAKSPYQRRLSDAGGLNHVPAPDGPVLNASEQAALRQLAAEVADRYVPVFDAQGRTRPWDIEFGFVKGELSLFQIRPLVERGQLKTDRVVRRFFTAATIPPTRVRADREPLSHEEIR